MASLTVAVDEAAPARLKKISHVTDTGNPKKMTASVHVPVMIDLYTGKIIFVLEKIQ